MKRIVFLLILLILITNEALGKSQSSVIPSILLANTWSTPPDWDIILPRFQLGAAADGRFRLWSAADGIPHIGRQFKTKKS
jgi:hypothetical protein